MNMKDWSGLSQLIRPAPTFVEEADLCEMHKVGDDYSCWVHFAIYEHQNSAGTTHQLYIRCDKWVRGRRGALEEGPLGIQRGRSDLKKSSIRSQRAI